MSTTSPKAEADDLDLLLSDFFKAQLKKPWPKAPMPPATGSEPSELVAARGASAPRNTPAAPAAHSSNARARFTLAASVALLLATGWFLTNGSAPATRSNGAPAVSNPGFLGESDAMGIKGGSLDEMRNNKMKTDGNEKGGIKLDKIGDDE